MEVDLLFLSRDLSPPRRDVWAGISAQEGVRLHVHRVIGPAEPGDASRFATIARARNAGKRLGTAPWVMLLDDDVVLDPHCVARLVAGLDARPVFAALAADCAQEMAAGVSHWDYPRHVTLASTLFRRERLEAVEFRWKLGKCDCLCCCEDLRRAGHAIGYLPGAKARHLPRSFPTVADKARHHVTAASPTGRILAAFDRNHYRLFVRRFLATLRRAGNQETVTAVVSGLYPSERRALAAMPNVEVVIVPADEHASRQRLRDFGNVIADWPEETSVAYWDAGDVVFQGPLSPLWDLVRAHSDRLLVAREVATGADNTVGRGWVATIRNPEARQRAMDFFMTRPILNGGFAAGTVRAMSRYLKGADDLLRSEALYGSTDWGDQTAMNLFCHTNPDAWLEVSSAWNYVLPGRSSRDYRVTPGGSIERLDGEPVLVAHGAGGTLRRWDLVHLTA